VIPLPSSLIDRAIRGRVDVLVPQLTLEEKASLLIGRDFWTTQPIDRLGIPSIWMTDGPTGVRKAPTGGGIGIGDADAATCFPTASLQASTWNRELMRQTGAAIGREARHLGVQILLGPGVNMKRSPLTGRNFEYMSEDPVLAGEMAAAFINGVQGEGVGTSIKHFVANENETGRMWINAVVDERTLREIYLRSFEIAIEKSHPWTVMCAYNRLNGPYCAEHHELLTSILKDDWGYEGIVMSDWGAVNDRPDGVEAGLHLQMPFAPTAGEIVAAVETGELSTERLDSIVSEMLAITFLAAESPGSGLAFDERENRDLAHQVAVEGIVLLKNDRDVLPILPDTTGTVAVLGAFAKTPRYQGSGSSQVTTKRTTNLHDALPEMLPDATFSYAAGYDLEKDLGSAAIDEAVAIAREATTAIVVIGLPDAMDAEGADRRHIDLPARHNELVRAVAAVQPRTIVVLINGSAVAMPWVHDVPAILESWLAGQECGAALADILTGVACPSGKLSETFPVRIEDTPHLGTSQAKAMGRPGSVRGCSPAIAGMTAGRSNRSFPSGTAFRTPPLTSKG
jgi:beta-glucosidase